MSSPVAVAANIWCIDTELYQRPGFAACYLIADAGEVALVDTGSTVAMPLLLAALDTLGFAPAQVRYLMPTHVHLDHAGGTGALLARLPHANVVAHPKATPHLIDPSKLWASACTVYGESQLIAQYGHLHPVPPERIQSAGEAAHVTLGHRTLHLLDTPGHARHHYCIYDPESQGIFTGDTCGLAYPQFANAAGTPLVLPSTTPTQFDPNAWLHTLERLSALEARWLYLTHYGAWPCTPNFYIQLRAQLQAYVAITATDPDATCAAVHALTAQALTQQGCRDVAAGLAWLADDIALNAQGLRFWQQQNAARALRPS